jgi:xanthine dehydrogenase accessory factor
VEKIASDVEILKGAICLLDRGRRVTLCTIIEKKGSGPRDIGGKMVVSEDGETIGTIGGGNLERALINESLKALREGKPTKAVFSLHKGGGEEAVETGLICGGDLTIFIDVIEPKHRLILIGAGHVAWPLAKLADIVGFSLVVVDDNEELANRERFPTAEVITGNFNEILDKLEVGPRDFVVIVHGEPEHDYLALEKIIKKRPAYVGLLGSKAKATTLVKRLKEAGISDEDLKLLHAPVGLDIGAQTPEEIGISILAEVINERRKGGSSP